MLRKQTLAVGALLVLDEIVTSRMSSGGMQKLYGVTPDLTALGKYLGAGFSFGAFGGRADLLDRFDPKKAGSLGHSGTFNNNVFTMTAGVVGLTQIFTPARAQMLFDDGELLRTRLNCIAASSGTNAQFTGLGSVMHIHFVSGKITSPEDLANASKELVQLFHLDMLEMGIYPARRGQLILSLPMTSTDFDLVANAVERFFTNRRDLIIESMIKQ